MFPQQKPQIYNGSDRLNVPISFLYNICHNPHYRTQTAAFLLPALHVHQSHYQLFPCAHYRLSQSLCPALYLYRYSATYQLTISRETVITCAHVFHA